MTSEPGDGWAVDLLGKLRELAKGPQPPASLEAAAVKSLREHGLMRGAAASRKSAKWRLIAAAACLLLLATGFFIGRRSARAREAPAGNQFVLFLNLPANQVAPDVDQEAQLVKEYSLWARQQRAAGRLIEGEKLNADAIELSAAHGPAQKRNSEKMAAGFFVIVAKTFDDAVSIARTCPHLRHGGSIVIRPIDRTP